MNQLKTYAMYLPQFYETPENSQWWGKGYTDWVALKKAKSLSKNHYQPRIPLNNNYYDLTNPETIRWQADIARKYGVDGFCIYHYYSNGKLLMEKPKEVLLNNKDINISYFLCWANHDFRKNWFDGDRRILRKQEYGDKEDMVRHYQYLSQFFKDKRYLKINNRPTLMIYDIEGIDNYNDMMNIWGELLQRDGFDGLYVISMICKPNQISPKSNKYKYAESSMLFEPLNTRSNASNGNKGYIFLRRVRTLALRVYNDHAKHQIPEIFDYNWANKNMLNHRKDGKQYYCVFPDWDNTPRYGSRGTYFKNSSPELFYKYAKQFIKKSMDDNNEFIFINAWNEWGESAYLEPDKKFKYAYLDAFKRAKDENNL